jgi:hypothetical protein
MMQARRNPSQAATKSQASVRVQRQCPVLAACSRDVPARVQTKRRSPSRSADLRIQSARREQAATHRTDCVRRSRMSAQSDGVVNRLEWNHLASFVEDSSCAQSIECGQPRHACCDEAAGHNDFSSHGSKGHSTGGVRPNTNRLVLVTVRPRPRAVPSRLFLNWKAHLSIKQPGPLAAYDPIHP